MEKLIAIIDVMPEYAKRLALYLNSSRTFPYRAVVFSCPEEAECHVKNDTVYAILAAEEMEKEILRVAAGTRAKLFWLCETKEVCHPARLYRYSMAKKIEQEIAGSGPIEKKLPLLGFYSPGGGCEAELLSRKIALELGKRGKVLYIPFFSFGIYGREWEDGLSEALYYIRQKEESFLDLRRLLQPGEYMDSIGPVRWYTDLKSISKEDIEKLLRLKGWNTEYSACVIAVGQFDEAGRNALNCCDRILVPVWDTEDGKRIQEEFRRQLKESGETKMYSGIVEFPVKDPLSLHLEEAVTEAIKKGGMAVAECPGGDSQADTGTIGFVGRADR